MSDFPLFDLFNRLRLAGFPLGLDEYHLLLQALQGGFGLSNRDALKRLCQALWVKSPQEARLFNLHFDKALREWRKAAISSQRKYEKAEAPSSRDEFDELTDVSPEPEPEFDAQKRDDSISAPHESDIEPQAPDVSAESTRFTPFVEPGDETETLQALAQEQTDQDEVRIKRFFDFSENYLPIGEREMQQSWRYLRFPVREGPPRELDIEATVRQIAAEGFLLAPVLIPRRVNRAELLLLLDQDGSMVPFHALSRRLRETALHGGRLGKANVFYFHNCPTEYLYHDRAHLLPETLDDLLLQLNPERTVVLIFSDAGAARGGYNNHRLERTRDFITHLRGHVQQIVWLNPMPRERWFGTTAHQIAYDIPVPMFETSRQGMDNAIDVLRGRAR